MEADFQAFQTVSLSLNVVINNFTNNSHPVDYNTSVINNREIN